MCDFGIGMMALTAIGGGLSVMGQQQQAKAQQQAANYNAQVARNNAVITEGNVRKAQLEGMKQEEAQRIKTANMIGSQRALFGASGLGLDSGSALDVMGSTAYMGQEDLLSIRAGTKAQEKALHQQATDLANQAQMDIFAGKNARSAANLQSAGTLLGTATNLAGMGAKAGYFGTDAQQFSKG